MNNAPGTYRQLLDAHDKLRDAGAIVSVSSDAAVGESPDAEALSRALTFAQTIIEQQCEELRRAIETVATLENYWEQPLATFTDVIKLAFDTAKTQADRDAIEKRKRNCLSLLGITPIEHAKRTARRRVAA